MDIKIKIVRENEDGSADAVVDFDDDGLKLIIQYGVIAMLKEGIDNMGKKDKLLLSKRSKQVVLEDSINSFHNVIEDIRLLYKTYGDRKTPMTEDEVLNALIGIEAKGEMIAYWAENAYEQFFELNDYASEKAKARRAAIMDWGDDDEDGRC
jgi:hypothetical protein